MLILFFANNREMTYMARRSWIWAAIQPSTSKNYGHIRKAQIEPPPEGLIEVNTDASFIFESGVASAGVVARDHLRSVIFSIGLKKQKLRLYYRVCISA
jgi:hypothetical protein